MHKIFISKFLQFLSNLLVSSPNYFQCNVSSKQIWPFLDAGPNNFFDVIVCHFSAAWRVMQAPHFINKLIWAQNFNFIIFFECEVASTAKKSLN